MDLIGEFHPASSKGNRYALTAIYMLTGFTFCIPLKNKTAEEVVKAYLNHICCVFGPSKKILTDNSTEFKNKMWEDIYKLLRTQHRVTPIYSPQCNSRIEGFHRFLKATVGKQIQKGLEWDDLVWKATSAYNFFPTESSGISPFFLMFGREAAAKHMLLAEESTKYVGDSEGILNLKLMQQLYHIIAYNLAKSRTARDGNRILKRKNFKPKHLKPNGLMLVRDHTSKAFEPKAIDHHIVDFCGKNQVLVKDNYGNTKKVHVKDVKPIEMDIATAEFFWKERKQCTTRDAKHVMPVKLIPDLEWEFIENIDVMKSDKGATIYCIKEAEGESETTQVTEVSEPETDVETTENIEPVATQTVKAPEDTQTTESVEDANNTGTEEPRYEHRESSETATEATVPGENSEIAENAEHREITKEAEPTADTGISQAALVDPTEDTETTEVSEHTVPEEIEVTGTADTIEIAEVATDANCTVIPEEIEAVAPRENKEQSENCSTSTTTPPGSPQRENPEIQNNSKDTTQGEAETEQAVKKTHQYPEVNNSLVNKIFSVFRQVKESNPEPAPEYGLQM